MFDIKHSPENPYGQQITTFIKKEFPVFTQAKDHALLDLLTEAIIGTGQVRYGSKPSPEAIVAIREVISHWTAQGLPIPVLTPWGSEKPDGSNVDLAELFGLKTLACLNSRVQSYYAPGVVVNIRIEDASAPHLFYTRMEQARKDAALYTTGMLHLIKAMQLCRFVNAVPESSLVSEETFNATADNIIGPIETLIINPNDTAAAQALSALGWKGSMARESIAFYLERYQKTNPEMSRGAHIHMLARYYAGSLTRHIVGSRGDAKEWGGKFLEIALHTPVPGVDAQRTARRVYYRTMPSSITSNHMSPWRAKGYLKIHGDEVTASLASFHADLTFNPNSVIVTNGVTSQEVRADYVIV